MRPCPAWLGHGLTCRGILKKLSEGVAKLLLATVERRAVPTKTMLAEHIKVCCQFVTKCGSLSTFYSMLSYQFYALFLFQPLILIYSYKVDPPGAQPENGVILLWISYRLCPSLSCFPINALFFVTVIELDCSRMLYANRTAEKKNEFFMLCMFQATAATNTQHWSVNQLLTID